MTLPCFLREHPGGLSLTVKLQPRAARNRIVGPVGDALKITVTAPPVDAAANEALLRLLAETLDCPRGAVQLARGHASRRKIVSLHGLAVATVVAKLSAAT